MVVRGQTQYWGRVLAARSGLVTAEQSRHNWAQAAASMEHRAGRSWRNLQDTTQEAAMGARRAPRIGGQLATRQRLLTKSLP